MKLFATADIHGNKTIVEKLRSIAPEVDLILICGDIGGKDGAWESFRQISEAQKRDADHLSAVLQELQTESRFILGNDDWFEYAGSCYLPKRESIGDLTFLPFEFVLLTPFNTNREVHENKLEYELGKLTADADTVVVAHMPPFGAGDILRSRRHCGSLAIRNWIKEMQPKLWLCGHIHENNSAVFIGDTLVLNCACDHQADLLRGWIVDTDTMQYRAVEL